jgi:hypothetical protein
MWASSATGISAPAVRILWRGTHTVANFYRRRIIIIIIIISPSPQTKRKHMLLMPMLMLDTEKTLCPHSLPITTIAFFSRSPDQCSWQYHHCAESTCARSCTAW